MQVHSRRIRILAAAGVSAVAVLATGSAGNAKTTGTDRAEAKQVAGVLALRVDRDGEWYVFLVNGVQRGLAFR